MNNEKPSLLIIGAGAAGLMAAHRLSKKYAITILEAQDRVGGRIHTLYNKEGELHFEAGAEFVHGRLPVTFELAKSAGATIEKTEGEFFTVRDGKWKETEEIIEGWDKLMEAMKTLREDMTLDAFLEMHFAGPEFTDLRRRTRAYAAGFDLADPTRVSVQWLCREWSGEQDEQYRIKEGYQKLIDYLLKECEAGGVKVLTGKRIKQVDWEPGEATAYTSEHEVFRADKIVITIPAGILQRAVSCSSINLTPPVDEYDHAWQQIGYGSVLKVVFVFKEAFWEDRHKDIGFILSEEAIPTWWRQPPPAVNVLTGWLGGPSAVQWDIMNDEAIRDTGLLSLAHIFEMPLSELTEKLSVFHAFRWHADHTACGAYSYGQPLSPAARELLNKPLADTVYFAGEALYDGPSPGTVEAALVSGIQAAEKLIKA